MEELPASLLDVNEPTVAGQDVADFHLVRTAVVDELLVEAHSIDRFGRLDVVGVFVSAVIGIRQSVEELQVLGVLVDALLEFQVDPEPLARG